MGAIGVILSSLASPYLFDEATQQVLVNWFIVGGGFYGFLSYGCWRLIAGLSFSDDDKAQPESLDVFSVIMGFLVIPFVIVCYIGTFVISTGSILYGLAPNRVKESIRTLW